MPWQKRHFLQLRFSGGSQHAAQVCSSFFWRGGGENISCVFFADFIFVKSMQQYAAKIFSAFFFTPCTGNLIILKKSSIGTTTDNDLRRLTVCDSQRHIWVVLSGQMLKAMPDSQVAAASAPVGLTPS